MVYSSSAGNNKLSWFFRLRWFFLAQLVFTGSVGFYRLSWFLQAQLVFTGLAGFYRPRYFFPAQMVFTGSVRFYRLIWVIKGQLINLYRWVSSYSPAQAYNDQYGQHGQQTEVGLHKSKRLDIFF